MVKQTNINKIKHSICNLIDKILIRQKKDHLIDQSRRVGERDYK